MSKKKDKVCRLCCGSGWGFWTGSKCSVCSGTGIIKEDKNSLKIFAFSILLVLLLITLTSCELPKYKCIDDKVFRHYIGNIWNEQEHMGSCKSVPEDVIQDERTNRLQR